MTKLTKKQKLLSEKVVPDKVYPLDEALELLNSIGIGKFKESVDVSINLGVDPRKSDQVVRGATTLPHGTGKDVRVAVFAQGDNAEKAAAAGADIVGFEDLGEEIKSGKLDFDVLIASPDAMRIVGQLGKVLGPRGLMPNPKTGTVVGPDQVADVVKAVKGGRLDFRVERAGIVHASIGKASMTSDQLRDNFLKLLETIVRMRPASAKGTYVKSIALSTTMGVGIRVDPNEAVRLVNEAR
jgi:large subunit ribosomal protein L1